MSEDFIHDLNEYFNKKFVNYEMISSMPSYESITISMVLKNRNRIEEGEYAANEMRKIAYQPNPDKVLAELKERYVDNNFTFSVRIAPFKMRIKALFRSKDLPGPFLAKLIKNYGETPEAFWEKVGVSQELWQKTLRGYYVPEKVLLFKIFLLLGVSLEDSLALMKLCGAYYNYEDARDVVVRYLIDYRVFNRDMIDRAFGEFHIRKIL